MRKVVIATDRPEEWIETFAAQEHLELKFMGRSHWHMRRSGSTGTLEATYDPATQTMTLEVRSNRTAPWVIDLLERHQ